MIVAPAVDALAVGGPSVTFVSVTDLVGDAARILGLAVAAGAASTLAAVVYRWYARARIPEALALLVGLAVVAVYLNTDAALSQVIGGGVGLLDPAVATRNVIVFVLAAVAAVTGRRVGDRLVRGLAAVTGAREVDADLSRLVTAVGRRITVELPGDPDDIDDIEGYDPVDPETKASLAGRALVFPRGLTVAALGERVASRLREDHGVGHVDIELAPDGTVEYLAVGTRAAGLGPSLAPGTAAVAVRADPAYSATSGDVVQLWTTAPEPQRVATGELRGTAGDVVTVALDEVDAESVDPDGRYRLASLPTDPRPDREFASLLRRADETIGVVAIQEGGHLAGRTVGEVDVTVVAVQPADGSAEAIPSRDRSLQPGDRLYVVARPADIRRLEAPSEPESS